ncbi:methyltransferase type 12 [Deinococcus cellulosilyticus NBRC 106333 = KACC 11606]|uniref:Methyltransferase type 12 n=1 Tax=Deinococcus cellulosilyticus (strain DSM 18568 / NBRC 106333 / KACC 11606 / 5516J-15) TaxID=1223518 RepID=A0A511N6N5_DEIC1|nr:methyltransferase type 12 [Deinococcus cellulosilyticus NBRC 106333 = KACC 11606]
MTFRVLDPDPYLGHYAGEELEIGGQTFLFHPLRVWMDLADRLDCHMRVPERDGPFLKITFQKKETRQRDRTLSSNTEKYGAQSEFQRIHKLEEPYFLLDAIQALRSLDLPAEARILDLGVNSGEELRLLDLAYPGNHFEVLGLDHSESALNIARGRFPQHRFQVADINALPEDLGTFDLILSIGTLQSANIEVEPVFRRLLKHIKLGGHWLLAFPNSRYSGGEISYGARMVNYREPELSLLFKDVAFFRRYFQKHRYSVNVTGKYYILVTARSLSRV